MRAPQARRSKASKRPLQEKNKFCIPEKKTKNALKRRLLSKPALSEGWNVHFLFGAKQRVTLTVYELWNVCKPNWSHVTKVSNFRIQVTSLQKGEGLVSISKFFYTISIYHNTTHLQSYSLIRLKMRCGMWNRYPIKKFADGCKPFTFVETRYLWFRNQKRDQSYSEAKVTFSYRSAVGPMQRISVFPFRDRFTH